tara:strand:+ start:200 stop:718 length:519 start_codon:yes stop_codon:yes gene_type:complete
MKKFKEGDEIVRVQFDTEYAPIGYKTNVLKGHRYKDKDISHTTPIVNSYWELAEDTSKPVYTKLMWQCDELPKIGMRFATEAGEYIAEYTNEKSVCFTDENGFLVAINRAYAKPIPAPIELDHGKAYTFDYSDSKDVVGVYNTLNDDFIGTDDTYYYSDCTNIRPMTVAESK